jgi:hypothetical protein
MYDLVLFNIRKVFNPVGYKERIYIMYSTKSPFSKVDALLENQTTDCSAVEQEIPLDDEGNYCGWCWSEGFWLHASCHYENNES